MYLKTIKFIFLIKSQAAKSGIAQKRWRFRTIKERKMSKKVDTQRFLGNNKKEKAKIVKNKKIL